MKIHRHYQGFLLSGREFSIIRVCFILLTFVGPSQLISQKRFADELIAYYPFDLDAHDYGENCLHGEIYGATSAHNRNNIAGKAMRFDGTENYIEVPHSSLLNFTNEEDFAISLWIKLEEGQTDLAATDNDILSKWVINDNTNEHYSTGYPFTLRIINKKNHKKNYFYWAQFGGFSPKCKSDVDPHSRSPILKETFFHLCLNVKANRFYFYINGQLENMEGSSVICDPSNVAPLRIGKRGGLKHANHFKGIIDDLAFWSRALSQEEIEQLAESAFDLKQNLYSSIKSLDLVKADTLFFDTDVWQLSVEQKDIVSSYLDYLDLDGQYKLLIAGHTNNLCEAAYCEELSMKRASIVHDYLRQKGYGCHGISSTGWGKTKQIADNKYPLQRKKNQRVEIELYKIIKP